MYLIYRKWMILANFIIASFANTFPLIAHEFWIEPKSYVINSGERLIANLRIGQNFKGDDLVYNENEFNRFSVLTEIGNQKVLGRLGDRPALNILPKYSGVSILIHQSEPTYLTYDEFEKFKIFSEKKGFPNIQKEHIKRGLPGKGFTESYTRFAKSIVVVGVNKGSDKRVGLELELVVDSSIYKKNNKNKKMVTITLFYQKKPYPNATVQIFSKNKNEFVRNSNKKTDIKGKFQIENTPDTIFLINSVVLRPVNPKSNNNNAVWESLWASTTFQTGTKANSM
jgi:uncharacterized GH25 family protein